MHAGGANRAWNLEPVAYFEHGDYVIKSSPSISHMRADATSTVRCAY